MPSILPGFVMHRARAVMAGDDVLLQCEIRSNLATPHWTLNGQELKGYDVDSGYRTGTDGLLIIGAQNQQSGHYCCYAVENSVWVPVHSYMVRVQPVPPLASHFSGSPTALPESFFTTTTAPTPSPSAALWSSFCRRRHRPCRLLGRRSRPTVTWRPFYLSGGCSRWALPGSNGGPPLR